MAEIGRVAVGLTWAISVKGDDVKLGTGWDGLDSVEVVTEHPTRIKPTIIEKSM